MEADQPVEPLQSEQATQTIDHPSLVPTAPVEELSSPQKEARGAITQQGPQQPQRPQKELLQRGPARKEPPGEQKSVQSDLEIKFQGKVKQNSKLRAAAKEWKAKAELANSELNKANSDKLQLEKRLADMRTEVEYLVQDKEQVTNHFRQQVKRVEEEKHLSLKHEKEKLVELERKYAVLSEKCNDLTKQSDDFIEENRNLSATNEEITAISRDLKQELNSAREQLRELEEALACKNEEMIDTVHRLEQELEVAAAENSELQTTIALTTAQNEANVKQLQQQLEDAEEKSTRGFAHVDSEFTVAQLQQKLEIAAEEQEQLKEAMASKNAESNAVITELHRELVEQHEELERALAANESLQPEKDSRGTKINRQVRLPF